MTTTTTSTDELLERASQAQAAADEARAQAREAEAELSKAREAEKAEAHRRRIDFERARRRDYPRTYGAAIRQAREAFVAAVREGGDVLAAWVEVRRTIATATAEESAWRTFLDQAHDDAIDATRERLRVLNRAGAALARPGAADEPGYAQALAEYNRERAEVTGQERDPAELPGEAPVRVDLPARAAGRMPGSVILERRGETFPEALAAALSQVEREWAQDQRRARAADLAGFPVEDVEDKSATNAKSGRKRDR